MKAGWTARYALAAVIAAASVAPVAAQQNGAGSIRSPQSVGFNPSVASPFIPNSRLPQSAGLNPFAMGAFAPDIRNSFSFGFNPALGSPFVPDFRGAISGTFNPAAAVPFGAVGLGISVGTTFAPGAGFVNDPTASPFFFTTNGFGGGVGPFFGTNAVPVAVPVPVPVYVPVRERSASVASRRGTRTPRQWSASRELRSVVAAESLMARTPMTEGTVVAASGNGFRVRLNDRSGKRVIRFPRSQVFFFSSRGEMLSAAVGAARLSRGARVLVPVRPMPAS